MLSAEQASSYPGERYGLPETGPGSVATLAVRGGQFFLDGKVNMGLTVTHGDTSLKPLVSADWWRERPALETWCKVERSSQPASKAHAN